MKINEFANYFNEQKVINAVLYIAGNLKRKDFHKIFKILYFSDRDHLSKYGRTITGDIFIAMDDGPVPSKTYDIFKALRGDGYFKDDKFLQFFEVENWQFLKPLKEADMKELSKSDVKIIDENLRIYGDLSWEEIKEKSHDYAWNNTPRNFPIDLKNILLESGDSEDYINYLKEEAVLANEF